MAFWSFEYPLQAVRGLIKYWTITFGGQTYTIPQPIQFGILPGEVVEIFLEDQQEPPITGMTRPLLGLDPLTPVTIDALTAFVTNYPEDEPFQIQEFSLLLSPD